jgi:hypothetical protein
MVLLGTPFFVINSITAPVCLVWCFSSADTKPEDFLIKADETKDTIIKHLAEQGFIKSQTAFNVVSLIHNDYRQIEPGQYLLTKSMDIQDIYTALHAQPEKVWITIPNIQDIDRIGGFLAGQYSWDKIETAKFAVQFREDFRNHFKKRAIDILTAANKWKELEKGIAEQLYSSVDYDLFTNIFEPGTYLMPSQGGGSEIAAVFFEEAGRALTTTQMPKEKIALFTDLVKHEIEVLPDMIPLPPRDIQVIASSTGRTLLVFSSAYWNAGKGPLELMPGPRDKNHIGDVQTPIYQRIYREDGTYRSRYAGSFLWHDYHQHYHFDDYMDYVLESANGQTNIRPIQEKTSFCLRDTELTQRLPNTPAKPKFTSCKTDIQGVSVGWGDVYKYTLADQDMDITDLPAGLYHLKFQINFGNHFDELRRDNNISSILLYLDPANKTVEIKS